MKRRIHQNVWGNWKAYEGTRRVWDFGTDDYDARLWVAGKLELPIKVDTMTNEQKHTPGPWEIHGDFTQQLYYVHGSNAICDIRRDSRFYRSQQETEANAKLIARAPELLAEVETLRAHNAELVEALKTMVCAFSVGNGTENARRHGMHDALVIRKAQDILAKVQA